ncbi:MAG: Probable ATP-dependent helicase lhr [uncultured Acidimicrobiales bacterium]|uniref:Probable ATP-dependent helicase lhr n=1 Tax=uncultured Acidimicrobiales bacterium TaxID=310071 RepID=A0A6J4IAH5_9ACTN|nr:MAG: Probable ATP-dependent helicase lhr [uncultured Acidimicrobiales bacterium]
MASLDRFSSATSSWFRSTFAAPTEAQEQGWEAISRGDHTLILAPTGSGKTLAAFLWALDRLATAGPVVEERKRCRVLYISPLKALTYDVERNLRAPLVGMEATGVRVGTRTGDTTEKERRDIHRHPPDILVTTPESLYLMLTSQVREILASVEHVIIDEIHAVAATKRGAHLALSLERLDRLCDAPPQRIGLSATQRPLDELARFLGGRDKSVTIVDAGVRKQLDIEVIVPVEDMADLGRRSSPGDPDAVLSGPAAGDPEVRSSIWPSIHPVLLELIRTHTSTLIFVNARGTAERLAGRLNELAREQAGDDTLELVRAHHGSIAREQRLEIEDALKAGKLPALVATSSLELGIDMGAIDLVVQVQAPTSVASGLQRIGRAGHQVGEPSKGKVFPKARGDLVLAAVTSQRMQAGLIEETRVPRNPLDVLAQQIIAMVAVEEGIAVDEVWRTVTAAYPYADLTTASFEAVLDMLAGRYPSAEFAEFRPRVVWDRVEGTLESRPGSRMLAITSGGTIPDRGLYGVFIAGSVGAMGKGPGGRIGELDEEMVYESREGETFVLGATTWRIEEITRDRVLVTPAPGVPGKLPFWKGDAIGRPFELGQAVGQFVRELEHWSDQRLRDECGLDDLAVANLRQYVADEMEATGGVLATDRQIVIERFRDELGDWQLCILSPYGSRVHAPWALAIEASLHEQLGYEVQTVWGDDGIVLRLPDADELPPHEMLLLDPDEVEDRVVEAVAGSAMFAGRFRENAARALLLPRRAPGRRTPLWQMRQRAADLQRISTKYGSFPIILETYRECLRDVFDLPALRGLLGDIRSRKIRVVPVDTSGPSPFAGSLVWSYVNEFLAEGDIPVAERKAQALTLDRRMLAELLGADELRELIDPAALDQLEAELQSLDERRWASSIDGAADLLRRLGDLSREELRARSTADFADALVSARRAVAVRIAGEERLIAVEDAGRYRDALGVAVPRGVPEAFLEPVSDALEQVVGRWARTHGPFTNAEPAARFGIDATRVEPAVAALSKEERLVRGAFRPVTSLAQRGVANEREWCDVEVLRMLRQRSLAALRREVEPAEVEALVRFLPAWHGIGSRAKGIDRLYEVLQQLQGVAIPASVLEPDVLAVRVSDYTPRLLDELAAAGEVVWMGAGSLARGDGRVLLHMRGSALARTVPLGERPTDEEHDRLRALLEQRGSAFFRDLAGPGGDDRRTLDALWDLVWAGEVTNDSFAALRSYTTRKRTTQTKARGRPRLGTLSALGPPTGQGRWSLVDRTPVDPTLAAHAVAATLLERHGVLTREAVRGEGVLGGFAGVYPVLRAMEESGRIRRGYFVTGLGGAQFAVPGAVDRLRSHRSATPGDPSLDFVLAATDPANPFGVALPWPAAMHGRPARVPGAYVVVLDGLPSLYVERGGKGLVPLRDFDGSWEEPAVAAVDGLVSGGRFSRLIIERRPPELDRHLQAAGFVPTPKGMTRYG